MEIPVILRGKDEASAPVNAGFDRISKKQKDVAAESARTAKQTRDRFREMGFDIARDFSGSAGQIVGHLSRIPSALGTISAVALSTGTALIGMAARYAEANSSGSENALRFMAAIKNTKDSFSQLSATISENVLTVLNAFLDLTAQAPTKLDILNAATIANFNALKNQASQLEQARGALKEYLTLNDKSNIIDLESRYFNLVAEGRLEEARQIANVVSQLKFEAKALEDVRAAGDRRRENAGKERDARQKSTLDNIRLAGGEFDDPIMNKFLATVQKAAALEQSINATFERLDEEDKLKFFGDLDEETRKLDQVDKELEEFFSGVEGESKKAKVSINELSSTIVTSLAASLQSARGSGLKWFDVLLNIGAGVFTRIITGGLGSAGVPGFANGGIIDRLPGAQNGMIVNRPQLLRVGENYGREAVIPLSDSKSAQREAVMNAAGLNRSVVVNLNVNGVRSIDPTTLRNRIAPMINKEVRKGMTFLSTGTV